MESLLPTIILVADFETHKFLVVPGVNKPDVTIVFQADFGKQPLCRKVRVHRYGKNCIKVKAFEAMGNGGTGCLEGVTLACVFRKKGKAYVRMCQSLPLQQTAHSNLRLVSEPANMPHPESESAVTLKRPIIKVSKGIFDIMDVLFAYELQPS